MNAKKIDLPPLPVEYDNFNRSTKNDGDGVMELGFYRWNENWWFIEGESDFVMGPEGQTFKIRLARISKPTLIKRWF